ncbi:MAG: ABC transporter ATP-binding protein [Anaerolineales bacterium]|jgi:branched-chain amino acid transport system ATP-binding protein
MAPPLLEVKDLHVGYGEVQVLRGVSIDLQDKERIGLFGPNGHGKTTLLKTISGLLRPWKGEIRFAGKVISGKSPRELVEVGIIQVPQGNTLFPRMSVMENLLIGAYADRAWKKRRQGLERVFELFPRLAERKSQLCRTLSGGERQMLAMGVGLMGHGQVLMLDEPTLGLAPKIKDELREAIQQIAATGVPMILVEQDLEFLLALTDRLLLVQEGRIVLEKTHASSEIEHARILEMYFGGLDQAEPDLALGGKIT